MTPAPLRRVLTRALPAAALLLSVFAGSASAQASCPGAIPENLCAWSGVSLVGQSTGGVLRFPQAVAVGPDGSVFVADQKSHAIQQFNSTGTFVRSFGLFGSKPGQITSAGGVAVAPDGSVYVTTGSNRVDRFAGDGSYLGSFGSSGSGVGQFQFGSGGGNDAGAGGGIAISGGYAYIADTGNDRVQRFDLDGANPRVIVAPGTLKAPMGLSVRKTRLLVADDQNHRIVAFDTGGKQLAVLGKGLGAAPGQLNAPYDVAVDNSGRVFVADDLNHRVSRFSSAGTGYAYKARWGSYGTAAGQLAYPRGIAVDGAGNVYVANTGDDRIDVFDNGGQLLRSFGTSGRASGQYDGPLGIAADASGVRVVTDSVNGRIQFLGADGATISNFGSPNPGPTVLPRPVAVAFDGAGNVYALDQRRSRVLLFSRVTGQIVRQIGSPGSGPGQMLEPSALTVSPGGTIYVADTGNDRIAKFAIDGTYLGAITGVGDGRGIALTPDAQQLYLTTGSDNRITGYDLNGNQLVQFGGRGSKLGKLTSPAGIAIDAAGNVWVADKGNNRIQQFGLNGERVASFGTRGTGVGQFINPTGVSVDCRGILTVADYGNNRLQQFALAGGSTAPCATLPAVGVPAAPKAPTLPAPDGPVLSAKITRKTSILSMRSVPLSVGCDTACTLTTAGSVTPRAKPKKGAKVVSVPLTSASVKVAAGARVTYKLALSNANAAKLRKALKGRKAVELDVTVTATGAAGEPTTQTFRISSATA